MKLFKGLVASCLFHALLFGASVGFMTWQKARATSLMYIDLRQSSLLLRPRNALTQARRAAPPSEPWILATGKRPVQPMPQASPAPTPQPEEEPTTSGEGTAGTGENWLPAAAAARLPEWTDGLIREEDYPPAARKQGKEGKVVAIVAIDTEGKVRAVQISKGSHPEFNQLVLERLRSARFRPARDQNDLPIAVRVAIPVVFELH